MIDFVIALTVLVFLGLVYCIVETHTANRRAKHDRCNCGCDLRPPTSSVVCKLPPENWACSRPAGHPGPCAAYPVTGQVTGRTPS